jgi:hypothetical protein
MFQVSPNEAAMISRSKIVTLGSETGIKPLKTTDALRSQIVTLKRGEHRKYRPYAFTEQGVGMLSGVLNSPRAVRTHVAIIRAFVQLRQMLSSHADLSRKLAELEGKYDKQFRVVFDAIRALMSDKKLPKREIGFHTLMPKPAKSGDAKAKKIRS